ncbi:MAG: radical SAM protein [Betaproteobacteria bacterium]|nr:radical SAM protein [Betaproteobacteria bacterium]MDE2621926.1 radical SAM protein [Betaproteobacteria bacterium]
MVRKQLSFDNHNRDILGLTYVYPVVSRRAEGVSIGINLNTNHACNWACVYCQVPDLVRGSAPTTDLEKLRTELDLMLSEVLEGRFMEAYVAEGLRRLNDIAFSGNGEPTSADYFEEAVAIAVGALQSRSLTDSVKLVVITNGSFALQPDVQRAFRTMAQAGGEVWFKADRGRAADILRINQVNLNPELLLKRLAATAEACPTWLQTCMTAWDGEVPGMEEVAAYLNLLQQALRQGIKIRGVLLYSLARPSHQPDAARIAAVPVDWLESMGDQIRALGLEAKVTP